MTLPDFKIYYEALLQASFTMKLYYSRQCDIIKKKKRQINRTEQRSQKKTHINEFKLSLTNKQRQQSKNCFSTNDSGKLDINIQKEKEEKKKNLDADFIPFTENNLIWITDLNGKCETMKLLEDNIQANLDGLGYGNEYLHATTKA